MPSRPEMQTHAGVSQRPPVQRAPASSGRCMHAAKLASVLLCNTRLAAAGVSRGAAARRDGRMDAAGPAPCAAVQGTTLVVEDLFYNMLTRKKARPRALSEPLRHSSCRHAQEQVCGGATLQSSAGRAWQPRHFAVPSWRMFGCCSPHALERDDLIRASMPQRPAPHLGVPLPRQPRLSAAGRRSRRRATSTRACWTWSAATPCSRPARASPSRSRRERGLRPVAASHGV